VHPLAKRARGGEQHPVQRGEPRRAGLAAQNPHLVLQDQDLQVLRAFGAAEADDHGAEGSDEQGQDEQHRRILRSCWSGCESDFLTLQAVMRED
jgi:hypothetical protein